jgi:divalent metal cation (Fe/Co/Zn/Cd) transporter
MDGVEPELVEAAESTLAAVPGVTAVRSVRMRWIGHELHAEAELDVDTSASLLEAHALAHRAESDVVRTTPRLRAVVVHAYPAHHDAPVTPVA